MTPNPRPSGPGRHLGAQPPPVEVSLVLPLAGVVDDAGGSPCRAVRRFLGDTPHLHLLDVVTCDATEAEVDLGLVGALARLALTARRHGCALRVRGASPELVRLVDMAGLAGVLPVAGTWPPPPTRDG